MTRNTGLKTLFYNSFYLWLFKRHLISDKSETRGWCSCISSELIPGNHSKSQSQIRGFPLSKNSGWPAIKLSLVNRWRSQSEMLVTHSLLLEPFYCMRQCRNASTTPLRKWGFRQCLHFSWTTLRGKHCRHPIAMEVVDTSKQKQRSSKRWLDKII